MTIHRPAPVSEALAAAARGRMIKLIFKQRELAITATGFDELHKTCPHLDGEGRKHAIRQRIVSLEQERSRLLNRLTTSEKDDFIDPI